jgi:hypothetical protein
MSKSPKELFLSCIPDYFGSKEGACSVLFINQDDTQIWLPNNGCHAVVLRKARATKSFYSSLWCRYEELFDAAQDYWNFLLSPAISPYRAVLSSVEIVRDDKGRPLAFGLHDNSASWTQCVSLAIQCRVPQESSNKLRSYWWWRKNGFTPAASIYISELLYLHIDGSLSVITESYVHSIDPQQGFNLAAFTDGTPKKPDYNNGVMKNADSYSSPTGQWFDDLTKPTIPQLVAGKPKYCGLFKKVFLSTENKTGVFEAGGCVSKEEAVTLLKEKINQWAKNVKVLEGS